MEQTAKPSFEDASVIFDHPVKHAILRELAHRSRMTPAGLTEATSVHAQTLWKHLKILEDLGIVSIDLPRGARQGRSSNVTLNPDAYEPLLGLWCRELSLEG